MVAMETGHFLKTLNDDNLASRTRIHHVEGRRMHNLHTKNIVGTPVQGWTKMPVWLPDYQPGAAIANVASGRTSPDHSRHSCSECYVGEIVHCATTSQKLLAHDDAA